MKRNMPFTLQHPAVVVDYIQLKSAAEWTFSPLDQPALLGLHTNRMGVVPKGHMLGKRRLITDISSSEDASVNDSINPELCFLQHTLVEQVGHKLRLSPGACPSEQSTTPRTIVWNKDRFADAMLPLGLRLAPKIFTAVADLLAWCSQQCGGSPHSSITTLIISSLLALPTHNYVSMN